MIRTKDTHTRDAAALLLHTGGWQLSKGHTCVAGEADVRHEKKILEDMKAHVEAGITAFDCGDIYSGVEELIGQFLQVHQPSHICPRRVQVHTKFVPDLAVLPTITEAYVRGVSARRETPRRLFVLCFVNSLLSMIHLFSIPSSGSRTESESSSSGLS